MPSSVSDPAELIKQLQAKVDQLIEAKAEVLTANEMYQVLGLIVYYNRHNTLTEAQLKLAQRLHNLLYHPPKERTLR